MNLQIVADGWRRLRRNPEFQAKLRELRQSIEARHAAQWQQADFLGRLLISWRIEREFRRESSKVVPSPESLYVSRSKNSFA
jgi:hypothetical protein